MKVESLKKLKNNLYSVVIDNNTYKLDEEVILNYRLVIGKEIDNNTLNEALKANNLAKYYHMTSSYTLKYLKSRNECLYYLKQKGLNEIDSTLIVNMLEEKKIINDLFNATSISRSYIINGYGILYIKDKLYKHQFSIDVINNVIDNINYDDYNSSLKLQLSKMKLKYIKETNSYLFSQHVIKSLLQRGYLKEEIDNCGIEI